MSSTPAISLRGFSNLRGHGYASLTTFRKTGKPVPTPIWFAGDDTLIYIWTNAKSGKVKRLRNNPRVTVAPCTARGRVLGPAAEATAQVFPASAEQAEAARRLLRTKYGWQWLVSISFSRLFRRESVFLKVEAD